jgi:hypothetical protein
MALWGKTDTAGDKPKYLKTEEKAETFGVNKTEAQVASNRAKGIKTPGWVKTITYTDAQGNVRHKTETLVAMGSAETVAVMGDAADDAVVADA